MSAPAATPFDAEADASRSGDVTTRDAAATVSTPESEPTEADDGARRWRWRWPDATPALLGYVLVRLIGLLILLIFAKDAGRDFTWLLSSRFDAAWYQQIAHLGYNATLPLLPDGSPAPSNLAFFPLYPALIWVTTTLTPLSLGQAGILIAWLASFATAWGLFAIGKQLRSRAVGIVLAVLWGVVPQAVVQNMAYSESLLAALCVWSLYALLRRQWLLAGALCLLAGLTRPTANALIAAVGVTALVAIFRRQDGWRPWAAAVLAPLGYLGYLAFVGLRLGRLDGYFYLQREGWNITFDGGVDTVQYATHVLTEPNRLGFYMVTALIVLAIALTVLIVMERYPLPVVVFTLVSLVFVLGAAGAYHGKGRYLMPVFTLLLPVATGLAAARRRTQVVVLVLLVLASGWYGAYLTLDWTLSP